MHSTNLAQLEAGERAIAALRVAVHSLLVRYPDLPKRTHRGDFPFRNFWVDESGDQHIHYFTYIKAIDNKRIFRVESDDEHHTKLCIKFSTRYSADAHRKAHELGFAPALLAVNRVDDWFMVIMDDVSAEYASTLYDVARAEDGDGHSLLHTPAVSLDAAQALVKEKLDALHEAGFVHGDVRSVNVLVRNKNSVSEPALSDVLLVDFDWAGRVGEAVYPRRINPQVERPPRAKTGEKIQVEDDLWMVERLY